MICHPSSRWFSPSRVPDLRALGSRTDTQGLHSSFLFAFKPVFHFAAQVGLKVLPPAIFPETPRYGNRCHTALPAMLLLLLLPAAHRNTHSLHGSFPNALQLPDFCPQLLTGQPARAVSHPSHSEVARRTAPGILRGSSRGDEKLIEAEVEDHIHKSHGEQQPQAPGDLSVGETIPGSMLLSHVSLYNRTGDNE